MAEIDPYAVLGVPRTATREEIARAYRALAKRHHPDAGAPLSTTMSRINEAWSVLGSPARRATWDEGHAVVQAPHWAAMPPREPQTRRPVTPPPSRMDSGWAAFGVVAAVVLAVGVSMIGLSQLAGAPNDQVSFDGGEMQFDHPSEWIVAAGTPSEADADHRVVAHLVTFSVEEDQLCTSFTDQCALEPDDVPDGEASIVITAWEAGVPPVPEPVVNRPAGLDADAIIGGRPAAFDRREVDEDTTLYWWQLSPPGFPDRWIEVAAVLRGIVLEDSGVLADIEALLNTVQFRD